MNKLALLLFSLIGLSSGAQNLVPNGGFESYRSCPDGLKQLELAEPWRQANAGSPEFFHECGFKAPVEPFSGLGMAGAIFFDNSRSGVEYLQLELLDSLQAGVDYCLSFHLLADERNAVMIDRIGMHLARKALKTPNWEPFIVFPQLYTKKVISDTEMWSKIAGEFRARGGERFLTIGNFVESWYVEEHVNSQGRQRFSYYYVDEVAVWPKKLACSNPPLSTIDDHNAEEIPNKHLVLFDQDQAFINEEEMKKLNGFLEKVKKNKPKQLKLIGHTDSDADILYNIELSKRRVEAVDNVLKRKLGVSTYLLWEGETKPVNRNDGDVEKALNRRVEIILIEE